MTPPGLSFDRQGKDAHRGTEPLASLRYSPRTKCGLTRVSPLCRGGDDRDRTGDPLLAKQVLSQLSYAPMAKEARRTFADPASARPVMVGQGGFEPPTPRLSSVCSNQLSY